MIGCSGSGSEVPGFGKQMFCKHEWEKATCLAPRTCIRCGLTEGKTRSHEWGSTACHAPEGCIYCGTTEGMELTHTWQEDCRVCIYCGKDERPAEERFPDLLKEGLILRWQMLDAMEAVPDRTPTKAEWELLFDAEYSRIGSFTAADFGDPAMAEAADMYIRSVAAAVEMLDDFGSEDWESHYLNGPYQRQTRALYEMNLLEPITVPEAYQARLDEMLYNGEIIHQGYMLIDQVFFLDITVGNYYNKTYETTIENTTPLSFKWFHFDVDLLDEEGNLLGTETAKVNSWEPGEKVRFTFYTTLDFYKMDVTRAYWELDLS